jgi:hypothetical protein
MAIYRSVRDKGKHSRKVKSPTQTKRELEWGTRPLLQLSPSTNHMLAKVCLAKHI